MMGEPIRKIGVRLFLITGDPGSGKTTVLSRIILDLKAKGFTVGGVLTREIRSHGERLGFNLVDLGTDESSPLATSKGRLGPRVGKYRVDLNSLASLGVKGLSHAAAFSDIIVCDEVGPMELFSPEFRKAVESSILGSLKPCLCIVHKRLSDPLLDALRGDPRSKIYEVTFENRNEIPQVIFEEVLDFLEGRVATEKKSGLVSN